MTSDKGVAYSGGLQIIKIKKGTTIPTIVKTNMEHANHILKTQDTFHPSLFIITKKFIYYYLLDTKTADATKTSVLDQVIPILSKFMAQRMNLKNIDEFLGYQVIAEAWMGRGSVESKAWEHYQQGDLAHWPSRVECLINTVQSVGKTECTIYDIIRAENSEKVIELKQQTFKSGDKPEPNKIEMPKLPKIPKGFSKHFTKMYNQAKAEDHSNDESVLQDIVDAVKSEDKRYD